ncbi:MAG: T9SS type A sorting domain-containing protein, partial [Crocinitomicaceae bacterium]|nr:T9SS type A sorting domain-containing protein [Crocinitomicaceae bacterium]
SQVQIGATLYPGNNYEMTIGNRDIGLLVNANGASFPYQYGNLMSIHSSSLGLNAYPFFYYLRIKPIECSSIRSKVTAFLDTNCVITKIQNSPKTSEEFSVYPIPFNNEVSIKYPKSDKNLEVMIFDTKGTLVYEGMISNNQRKINLSFLKSKGIYFLKAVGAYNTYHQKLIKD